MVATTVTTFAAAAAGWDERMLRQEAGQAYLAGATLMLGVALPFAAFVYPGIFGGDQGLNVAYTTPGFLGVLCGFGRDRSSFWVAWIS